MEELRLQTPQREVDSLAALAETPVHIPGSPTPQVLGNLASIRRDATAVNVTQVTSGVFGPRLPRGV